MTRQDLMFAHIEACEHSNLPIAAFCAANALKVPTFDYWRRKFRASRSATSGFIPILPPAGDAVPAVRLSYPNGVSIHLSAIDLQLIAQLIRLA